MGSRAGVQGREVCRCLSAWQGSAPRCFRGACRAGTVPAAGPLPLSESHRCITPDPRTGRGRWGPGQCPSQSWTAFPTFMLLSQEAQQHGPRFREKGILATRPCEALGGAERADSVWPRSRGGRHDTQQCQAPRWFAEKSPLPCFCSADSPKQAVRTATDGSLSWISPVTPKLYAVFTESVPKCGLQAVSEWSGAALLSSGQWCGRSTQSCCSFRNGARPAACWGPSLSSILRHGASEHGCR